MGERARRIGANEAIFREVNERVEGLNRSFGSVSGPMDIVCECGDATCVERITLTVEQYEHVRSRPEYFAVVHGHEIPAVESVAERHGSYDVVEKHEGVPAALADETDPRS